CSQAFVQRLVKSGKGGAIVNLASTLGVTAAPNRPAYTASKHAVQGYFKSLRFELDQFNIKVSMVEPVWFKTNLGNHAVSAGSGRIADYNTYRKQANAATQKGIDEAEAPVLAHLHRRRQCARAAV
ncbi:MAG: SDR family NAD(P)-dependent oxidoreductase, partial [Kofleriaceae bacterium]